MKFTVTKPTEIEIASVIIAIPLRYDDDEGMERDFPMRDGDMWTVRVDLATGKIANWPTDKMGDFEVYEKVVDEGTYTLMSLDDQVVATIEQDYVPHGIVPGKYGDYVILKIHDGTVTNLPKPLDVSTFFPENCR